MASPDADPEEALILYLIFFHLLTVTEIRNAKIPSLVAAAQNPTGECDRARDFEYLLLPVREPSRGRQSPRREGPIVKYAKKAAWWLRPLLERYFEKRKLIGVSEYLFVGRYQLTQNRPVCDTQILDLYNELHSVYWMGWLTRGTCATLQPRLWRTDPSAAAQFSQDLVTHVDGPLGSTISKRFYWSLRRH